MWSSSGPTTCPDGQHLPGNEESHGETLVPMKGFSQGQIVKSGLIPGLSARTRSEDVASIQGCQPDTKV